MALDDILEHSGDTSCATPYDPQACRCVDQPSWSVSIVRYRLCAITPCRDRILRQHTPPRSGGVCDKCLDDKAVEVTRDCDVRLNQSEACDIHLSLFDTLSVAGKDGDANMDPMSSTDRIQFCIGQFTHTGYWHDFLPGTTLLYSRARLPRRRANLKQPKALPLPASAFSHIESRSGDPLRSTTLRADVQTA
jgi:hypothetical protein